jgi:Uma2 family endonuclease
MSATAGKLLTPDEFILWNLDQEERWELVDGVPVLKFDNGPEMMAAASERHDQIVVNLIAMLRSRLRGRSCRTKTSDQAARMERGNIRYPDVTIDCGKRAPGSFESVEPIVFFEVLSPSTRRFDLLRKAERVSAYGHAPSLRAAGTRPDQGAAVVEGRRGRLVAGGDHGAGRRAGPDRHRRQPADGGDL